MTNDIATSRTTNNKDAERIAFDHFIMVRSHMEELVSIVENLRRMPLSTQSLVTLRHAFLDVRMVIEELMLLSVSAHQDAGEVVTKRLRTEYSANKKMSHLRELNAHFFPEAFDIVPHNDPKIGGKFVQVSDEYLTEQEAKSCYNQCGDKLHATWKRSSAETYNEDIVFLDRFIRLTSRLLTTFAIDISGQGYTMAGHLNLGEPEKLPSLVHFGGRR